jgi:hypothetical protein
VLTAYRQHYRKGISMAEVRERSLIDRIIGVAKLDAATFEEIEHDESATMPALIIAALAGVSLGVGQFVIDPTGLVYGEVVALTIAFVIVAIIGLVLFTTITYIVGGKLLREEATELTWVELLRTLGFAGVPLVIAGWVPLISYAVVLWFLAAVVVAIRQAADVSTRRAIVIGLPGLIVLMLTQYLLLINMG